LTRGSILFAEGFLQRRWIAGSSPAMTIQRTAITTTGFSLRAAVIGAISKSFSACSLRLAAQDVALSRRKQGFESPRERHEFPPVIERFRSAGAVGGRAARPAVQKPFKNTGRAFFPR